MELFESERVPGILRKVTRPKWFNRTPWGTPRLVDTRLIRSLTSHVVFQACVGKWQSDLRASEYEVYIDDRDLQKSKKWLDLKEELIQWLAKPSQDPDKSIIDILAIMIKDMLEIDAGAGVKHLATDMHEIFDMGEEVEEATDPIERIQSFVEMEQEPAINFKKAGERIPFYFSYIDGGSLLKQFDETNVRVGFWQHPFMGTSGHQTGVKYPRIFGNREIIWIENNLPSYDNYGWSRGQQVFDILKFMIATILNLSSTPVIRCVAILV